MNENQNVERLAFSVMEAAQAIGVSSRTVRTLIKDGYLPHVKIGMRVLVEVGALRTYLASRRHSVSKTEPSTGQSQDILGTSSGN